MHNSQSGKTPADRAKQLAQKARLRADCAEDCGARDTAAAARRSARLLEIAAAEAQDETWVAK